MLGAASDCAEEHTVTGIAAAVRAGAHRDHALLLADLARWVALDSPSGDAPALDVLAADLHATLAGHGAQASLHPGPEGAQLRAAIRGRGRSRVVLLCHHDTVFARGTAAARPLAVEGGWARGPGVADMKGGLVVAAHAMRLLREVPDAFGTVELVSVPDEELRTVPFRGIESLEGADAALCMECGRPGDGIVTARKGGQWLSVEARGVPAHAGVAAGRGRSALLASCREALRLAQLDGAREGLGVHVTQLQAGEVPNAVPSRATMSVDVRAWNAEDLDWALQEIARFGDHGGVQMTVDAGFRVPPLELTPAVAALAAAATAIGDRLGSRPFEVATGGVSDACWTAAAGIPTLDGLGPIGEDDHGPDERVELASLAERCGLVAGLIVAVERGLEEPVARRATPHRAGRSPR